MGHAQPNRRLIVTADDFGAAPEVNDAVAAAHRNGILTAASLMVVGAAAGEAVALARTLPGLGVGLHLVLVEGRPMLPPPRIPALVDRGGRLRTDMARLGIDIALRPAARRQLAAEIEAQFAAFAATGLPLDHVNAHKHFHLHPVVAGMIVRIGARYGMRAARAPLEETAVLQRVEPGTPGGRGIEAVWAARVKRRLRRAGLLVPDRVFGLAWSGAMTAARIEGLIAALPDGLSEIYCHIATADVFSGSAPGYGYRAELAALTNPAVGAAAAGITLGSFAGLTKEAA